MWETSAFKYTLEPFLRNRYDASWEFKIIVEKFANIIQSGKKIL